MDLFDTHLIGFFVALVPCIVARSLPPKPHDAWLQAAAAAALVLLLARSPTYQSVVKAIGNAPGFI